MSTHVINLSVQHIENMQDQGVKDSGVPPQAQVTTRAYAFDLWALLKEHSSRHAPISLSTHPSIQPALPTGMHVPALRYLQLTPALLTVLFVISFVWDFPGMSLRLWNDSVAVDGLLRMLSVSAFYYPQFSIGAVSQLFEYSVGVAV